MDYSGCISVLTLTPRQATFQESRLHYKLGSKSGPSGVKVQVGVRLDFLISKLCSTCCIIESHFSL